MRKWNRKNILLVIESELAKGKMISFKNVTKKYDSKNIALKDISLIIPNNEFVFLMGESGAGKSTFLNLLLREMIPSSGELIVNGTNLSELKHNEIAFYRRKLGVVFQDYKLLPRKSVYDNIAFALQVIETPVEEIEKKVYRALNIINLSDKKDNYPSELSGGEQQRVAIARAIVNKPSIIIADEPTGNLDFKNSKDILNLFLDINEKYKTTIIMATHNQELVDIAKQRVIRLDKGEIISDKKFYG